MLIKAFVIAALIALTGLAFAQDGDQPAPEAFTEPEGPITLRRALSLALTNNPALAAFSWEVRAKEAGAIQAGLLPNPELEALLEEFGGSGSVEGFEGAETTILLGQLIPLGGKISKRKRLAALGASLAEWDYEAARLDVLRAAAKAFADVLAAQRQLEITEELVGLAEGFHKAVSEQASAGQISPIQEKRAGVALSQAKIRAGRARRELEAARKGAAATWGSTNPRFTKAEGSLDILSPVPPYDHIAGYVSRNPDIARWAAEMEEREAALSLEKADAVPDPFVSGGYRRIAENDDNAFVVGLSIPIPILNRNQGGILEARRRISKGEEEKRNAEVTVSSFLAAAYKDLSAAYEEAETLRDGVLPAAEGAYESVFEGYREGKFSLLDVLDAQRTVFDTELQYIQALRAYHHSLADVERLTGTPIGEIQNNDNSGSQENGGMK